MKLGIGIPTINRYDLLKEALVEYEKIYKRYPFIIIDNGHQDIPRTDWYDVIETDWNYGVARSWNLLIDELIKKDCTHFLILNDDIIFNKTPEEIFNFIQVEPNQFYTAAVTFDVFLSNIQHYKKVGKFDVLFYPMYYEDDDYKFRSLLANVPVIKDSFFNPVEDVRHKTCDKDTSLKALFGLNTLNYKLKWGGVPEEETYYELFGGSKVYGGPYILKEYNFARYEKSEINEHIDTLLEYSIECNHITELNTNTGVALRAFVASGNTIHTYDPIFRPFIYNLIEIYKNLKVKIEFFNLEPEKIEVTDLLFINNAKTYDKLSQLLNKHSENVMKYIIIHNTELFGFKGEDDGPGLLNAIFTFLAKDTNWKQRKEFKNNNGLIILERR